MIRSWNHLFFASAALLGATPIFAQEVTQPAAVCTTPAMLPVELASWNATRPAIQAATTRSGMKAAGITLGVAVDATLAPTPAVVFPVQPTKPGGSVSHGGLFAFMVPVAGTYRVALGSAAWVDVVGKGKTVASRAHGHGPDCSGIRKMVDYPLQPGGHILQISANGTPGIVILVTKLP